MGATRVCVGASDTTGTFLQPQGHYLHYLLDSAHSTLRQADNIDFLFTIFAALEKHSLVE